MNMLALIKRLFKNEKENIYVRIATERDIDEIVTVEKKVWPENMAVTRDMLISRMKIFPEGFFCAIKNGKITGFACSEIINYKDTKKKEFNWYNLTDNGYIEKSHSPSGDSLYGINLTVLSQGLKDSKIIASKLFEASGKLTIKKRLKRGISGARMPMYHKYSNNMSPDKYIFTRIKKGLLLDPELSLYTMIGMYPVKIIKNYFEDEMSLNYGVLVTWKNPYYKITKKMPWLANLLSIWWKVKIYKPSEFDRHIKKFKNSLN